MSLRFGGQQVLQDVGFEIAAGSICGLVGPNGAGKTSLFNCLTGAYRPDSGTAWLARSQGAAINLMEAKPHRLAALGVARTFQHPVLDPGATVFENALCGGHVHWRSHPLALAFGLPVERRREAALRSTTGDLLDELGLARWSASPAGSLPYGTQKRVELARALLTQPRLLLLDEPAGGLPQDEVFALGDLLRRLRQRYDLTILFVEHHMGLVARLSDRVVALVAGQVVAVGPAALVQRDPVVVEAYLGTAA